METSRDQRIGENIAAYRQGRSQEWLAEQMRERGHEKWSQSTVWAIEKGKRPLRFTEAQDIAEILDRSPSTLLMTSAERVLDSFTARANVARSRLPRTLLEYLDFRATLAEYVGHEGMEEVGRSVMDEAKEELKGFTLAAYRCEAGHQSVVSLVEGFAPEATMPCKTNCDRQMRHALTLSTLDAVGATSDG